MIKKNVLSLFYVFILFAIDRITKFYIIFVSEAENKLNLFSSKFVNLQLVWNEGIAFGLLSFRNTHFYQIITFIISIIILIILIIILREKTKTSEKYGFILIAGGALGNFYDRLVNKAVPDFIDLHIGNFHWFIFNIADIFITIGIIWLILIEIFFKNKNNETI
tara:strand:- start:40 stop:531 length:492 start_codon:yes stop_codon:yes gene_type:complete